MSRRRLLTRVHSNIRAVPSPQSQRHPSLLLLSSAATSSSISPTSSSQFTARPVHSHHQATATARQFHHHPHQRRHSYSHSHSTTMSNNNHNDNNSNDKKKTYSSSFVQPHFSEQHEQSYEKTLEALESLILKAPKQQRPLDTRQAINLEAMSDFLHRLNISPTTVKNNSPLRSGGDKTAKAQPNATAFSTTNESKEQEKQERQEYLPPVIHITGTKGKGSTCAFCQSILMHSGYRTGMFTSPHLIDVRERIRINGQPVSKPVFMHHFWYCYRRLMQTSNEVFPSMATYFRFLTVLAFRIFIAERVDVCILEVGVGGVYDSTNIVQNPTVTAITSIGLDHTDLLGEHLEQIALQKAGIMKPGTVCFTNQDQRPVVKRVLNSVARASSQRFRDLFLSSHGLEYYNIHTLLQKCQLVMQDVDDKRDSGSRSAQSVGENSNLHKNVLLEARLNNNDDMRMLLARSRNNLLSGGRHQQWNASLAIAICETFIYLNEYSASESTESGRRIRQQRLECGTDREVLKPETLHLLEQRFSHSDQQSNNATDDVDVEINDEPFELEPYVSNGLSEPFVRGILKCTWPGRAHISPFIDRELVFYLDGAHTDDSITFCTQWFKQKSSQDLSQLSNVSSDGDDDAVVPSTNALESTSDDDVSESDVMMKSFISSLKPIHSSTTTMKRVLVFNYTGTRHPKELLKPLAGECELFDYVVFLPIDSVKTSLRKKSHTDGTEVNIEVDPQIKRLCEVWCELTTEKQRANQQFIFKQDANHFLRWTFEQGQMHVLVTGSLYLVGDFLRKLNYLK